MAGSDPRSDDSALDGILAAVALCSWAEVEGAAWGLPDGLRARDSGPGPGAEIELRLQSSTAPGREVQPAGKPDL